jgi:ribonuclease BN (tRNA processing enzyme)
MFKCYYPHLKKLPVAAIVTEPVVTQLGDTLTGFEFELWTGRFIDFQRPHKIKFIGQEPFLKSLYQRLEITMNGDFIHDDKGNRQTKLVSRRWVDDVFEWRASGSEVQLGNVRIDVSNPQEAKIYDRNKLVFDSTIYPVSTGKDAASLYVDMMLSQIESASVESEEISLIVGGNGIGSKPGVTSNFIVQYGDRTIWIDPPARFHEKAVKLQINPDDVTDYVVTHCHEDHIEGFSALLQRKIERKEQLRLLSIDPVLDQLKEIFNPLFSNIMSHINYSNLADRQIFQNYFGCDIQIRDNYHPVPTIGMKFSYNGRTVAISGDTLYSKQILNARLENGTIDSAQYEILSSKWFSDAELFLHDTTVAKDPVHTDIEDVEDLAKEIPHVKAYGYHFGVRFESDYVTPTRFGDRL